MSTSILVVFFGVLGLGVAGIRLVYSRGNRAARDSPPTPKHAFMHQIPDTTPGGSRRARLTGSGWVVLLFACPAGLIGLGVTWGTVNKVLEDRRYEQAPTATAVIINPKRKASEGAQYEFTVGGQNYGGVTHDRLRRTAKNLTVQYLAANPASNRAEAKPFPVAIALLFPAIFDMAFLWLVGKLVRDHALVRRGRLTTGIVVGYGGNNRPGLQSLVTVFYDFVSVQGNVVRGHSMVANYTLQGPYYNTAVGSGVEVFYRVENPARNALKASLSWEP